MKTLVATLRDMLILGGIGLVVALTVNTVRARQNASGAVELTRVYFDDARDAEIAAKYKKPVTSSAKSNPDQGATSSTTTTPVESEPAIEVKHMDHPYQSVTFEGVVAIFDDPNTQDSVNIFVDARDDDSYEEGHIPGALQAFPQEIARYIDTVMQYAEGAEKVVVYCNGGDCTDSKYLCNELLDAGISYDRIYLFEGGWNMWTANGMPVETGRAIAIGEEE